MTDDIDIVAAALSGDKKAVLKDQLKRLEREELERLVLEILSKATIAQEILDIRNEILRLEPLHEELGDDPMKRRDRLALKKEVLTLSKEVRDDERGTWRDVQNLKREEREVQKELIGTKQRDQRLRDFTE